ncbi:MAG TPA: nicotinate-nucleotide adenylyltransferase [Candidatus Dormibacteraeota bacterium]|nr:nicotinate-nucleotide adenylyltransferase [Candidatus Dormibacteraeota bacterium]
MTRRTSVGLMGGTFDPIHVGHLAIAEEARDALGLDRIVFVPAGQPPHKPSGAVTAAEHRVAMVELAIAGNAAFELSRTEVDRPGLSYTVDTVEALAAEADLTVILSVETFAELPAWHEPERLFAAARLAVVPREGYPAPDPAWLSATFPGREDRVTYLEGPRLGLSSTALRARVAAGRSIRYLVPDAVGAYIAANHLYVRTAAK